MASPPQRGMGPWREGLCLLQSTPSKAAEESPSPAGSVCPAPKRSRNGAGRLCPWNGPRVRSCQLFDVVLFPEPLPSPCWAQSKPVTL